MIQYIPVHTIINSNFRHSISLISRYSTHHGTRQYHEVPKNPVHLNKDVQANTSWYKALYFLVPSYSGVLDFWVLHGTALYRDVSSNGKSGKCCVVNDGMYLYVLDHTSSYWDILLHTNS